jgi:hypothetical protein
MLPLSFCLWGMLPMWIISMLSDSIPEFYRADSHDLFILIMPGMFVLNLLTRKIPKSLAKPAA